MKADGSNSDGSRGGISGVGGRRANTRLALRFCRRYPSFDLLAARQVGQAFQPEQLQEIDPSSSSTRGAAVPSGRSILNNCRRTNWARMAPLVRPRVVEISSLGHRFVVGH